MWCTNENQFTGKYIEKMKNGLCTEGAVTDKVDISSFIIWPLFMFKSSSTSLLSNDPMKWKMELEATNLFCLWADKPDKCFTVFEIKPHYPIWATGHFSLQKFQILSILMSWNKSNLENAFRKFFTTITSTKMRKFVFKKD